jgi:hypothetical protein
MYCHRLDKIYNPISHVHIIQADSGGRRVLHRYQGLRRKKEAEEQPQEKKKTRHFQNYFPSLFGRSKFRIFFWPKMLPVPQLRRLIAGFPTRRPTFEPASSHVGSVADRVELEQVSSEYFGFLCQPFIPRTAPQSSPSIIQGWYNRPINGRSNSGFGSTPDK